MALSPKIPYAIGPYTDSNVEADRFAVRREGVRFFRGALLAATLSLPFWTGVLLFLWLIR